MEVPSENDLMFTYYNNTCFITDILFINCIVHKESFLKLNCSLVVNKVNMVSKQKPLF